jgi:hypothetical protein
MFRRSIYSTGLISTSNWLQNLIIYIELTYINQTLFFWVNNFLHEFKHKISRLGLKNLTRLIKWLDLELIYIVYTRVLTRKPELPPYKYIHRRN